MDVDFKNDGERKASKRKLNDAGEKPKVGVC